MFNRPLKLYLVDVYFKEQHNGEINNCIIYISPLQATKCFTRSCMETQS